MADVKFNRGYFDKLPKDIKPGTISIAEDSQELYIDTSHNNINKRIRITDIIDITGRPKPTILYSNKIYINGNKIQKVINNELIDISSVGNSVLNVDKDINRDTLTIGTLDGLFGKVGDFIIDSKGNIGIVKELINNKTKVQIVSMIGDEYDNQKIEYFINIGNKVNSKNLGTLEHPYNSLNELQEKLQNSEIKIVLNCVSNFDFGDISNWNNNVINGNNFTASFTKFENNNNVQLNNCKFNTNNINHMNECNNISINSIIGKFQFNSCENVKINEFENYLKFTLCNNLYLDNIKSNNTAVNITTEQQSGNVIINNCICNLSMSNSIYNDDIDTNVIIQNSKLNSINIDENVYNVQLMSGVCTDNTGVSTIAAKIINLGTFEFFSKPTFGDTSKILDKVGLSSKQVFDEKNRSYINNYINKSNTLTNDDKKVNLEFHLDAIDDSLNNINESINSLSEEGSGLTEAYISKGTFKTVAELESQTWRTGDVVKFIAKTPIKISKRYNLNIIKLLEITTSDQETSEEKKYFDFYFLSNDILPYFVHSEEIITIVLVDGNNSTEYELPIHYCNQSNIICRIEQNDDNKLIFTPFDETDTEQINKYASCTYDHVITLNEDDRLIYIDNDWDKLSSFDVNGSGRYIDADLLNGKRATDFFSVKTPGANYISTFADAIEEGLYRVSGKNFSPPDAPCTSCNNWACLVLRLFDPNELYQIAFEEGAIVQSSISGSSISKTYEHPAPLMYVRHKSGTTWGSWAIVWNSKVQGPDSGLNADKLDGKQSTEFVYNDITTYTSIASLPNQTGMYYVTTTEITGTLATFAITKFYYSSSAYTLQASNCTDGTMYFGSRSGSTITWKKVGAGVEVVTADPTNAATGDIWIRSDLS